MHVGRVTPALEPELLTALRELNNAAIAARAYVHRSARLADALGLRELQEQVLAELERLDAAIADAGELLERTEAS